MFYKNINTILSDINIHTTDAIIIVFLIFILTVGSIYYIRFKRFVGYVDKIPGPKCSHIFGKLIGNLELFWTIKVMTDFSYFGFQVMAGLTKTYQDIGAGIFRAWIGPFQNYVVIFRADTVETILSSNIHIEKSREYKFFQPWLGLGLLTSTGDHWRSHRKLLTPSFHFRILENFVPVINGQKDIMIDIIDKQLSQNNGIIDDIRPVITNCALDTICETAMGVTVKAQTNVNSEYVNSLRNVLMLFLHRFLSPWLWPEFIYQITSYGKQFKANTAVLHEFTDSVIKERKTELLMKMNENKGNKLEELVEDMGSKRRLAFLDSLLVHHIQNPREFTELDIRDEVDTFMFEGHDTTAAAIQFALMLIGLDPHVQAKIHSELDAIFSDDMTRDITIDDLRQLKYLEQCIKESLRLYPSVPYVARNNNEPIRIDNYEVPARTTCMVFFYMLHRDPHYYPNPEVFDPNRFDTDATGGQPRHPYAYVPFSAGPRNCIGQKFALLEEKALLAAILRRYDIRCLTQRHDLKLDIAAILKPNSNITMRFAKRF